MKSRLKQFFCQHNSILIKTEVEYKAGIIVTSTIRCDTCGKSFPQRPHYDIEMQNPHTFTILDELSKLKEIDENKKLIEMMKKEIADK
jgi:hypothetical protein